MQKDKFRSLTREGSFAVYFNERGFRGLQVFESERRGYQSICIRSGK